jgi:hypothetical protein
MPHSKRPWRRWANVVQDANGNDLAVLLGEYDYEDARLIVAAPEVLRRLRRAMERCQACNDDVIQPCAECMDDTRLIEDIEWKGQMSKEHPGLCLESCCVYATAVTLIRERDRLRADLEAATAVVEDSEAAAREEHREIERLRTALAETEENAKLIESTFWEHVDEPGKRPPGMAVLAALRAKVNSDAP